MKTDYINNTEFEHNIKKYLELKNNSKSKEKEFEIIELALTKSFYLLSEKIFRTFKFAYIDWDEALQEGVLICFDKLHRFNPELGKAFVFCSAIIFNHFKQLYRQSKTHQNIKNRYKNHLIELNESKKVRRKGSNVNHWNFSDEM